MAKIRRSELGRAGPYKLEQLVEFYPGISPYDDNVLAGVSRLSWIGMPVELTRMSVFSRHSLDGVKILAETRGQFPGAKVWYAWINQNWLDDEGRARVASELQKMYSRKKNPRYGKLSVFDKHRKKIALQTLKYSDAGARIMGGMTKDQAREFLRAKGIRYKENPADPLGFAPPGPKISQGVYYFKTEKLARAAAEARGWPTNRIIQYKKGWTIQGGISGDYAGPDGLKVGDWIGCGHRFGTSELAKNPRKRRRNSGKYAGVKGYATADYYQAAKRHRELIALTRTSSGTGKQYNEWVREQKEIEAAYPEVMGVFWAGKKNPHRMSAPRDTYIGFDKETGRPRLLHVHGSLADSSFHVQYHQFIGPLTLKEARTQLKATQKFKKSMGAKSNPAPAYVIVAQVSGKRLTYDAIRRRFSDNSKPSLYATALAAQKRGLALLKAHPKLGRYKITVQPANANERGAVYGARVRRNPKGRKNPKIRKGSRVKLIESFIHGRNFVDVGELGTVIYAADPYATVKFDKGISDTLYAYKLRVVSKRPKT